MEKIYIIIAFLVSVFNLSAQNMDYSLSYIGVNSGTGNYEIALVATPDFTETNGNSADMGAVISISGGGYLLPTNTGFVNDCVFTPPATNVCDYAITATEWDASYLAAPSSTSGRYVYQLLRTPGVTNVLFDAVSGTPIIMAVFQVAGNPTSGDVVLVNNNDAILNSTPNENYLNINYTTGTIGSTADVYGTIDATPVLFSVLSTPNVALENFEVYPNPTRGDLYIDSDELIEKVEVFNYIGQKVLETTQVQINTSTLNSGMYLLKVYAINGKVGIKRFIKE